MKKNKKLKVLTLLMICIVVLQGCGTTQTIDPCNNDNIKIGVVTDVGGVHDKSFNQGTWEGVQNYCTDSGIGATVVESTGETDYIPNLTNLTNQEGIEAIVAIGENLEKSVYNVAKDNQDIKYIIIDGEPKDKDGNIKELDNVKSYKFKEQESGYLVGYIAAKASETKQIGFIGGEEITPVQKFGWGYVQGAYAADPNVVVNYQYSGTFSDSTKGQQIADSMYGNGVDVIFSAAGGTNSGVLNSAKTRANSGEKVYVVGVDRDMYEDGIYSDSKSVILTSALKNVDSAVYQGLEQVFNLEFEPGLTLLGYNEGGVGVPDSNPNISDTTIITDAEESLSKAKVEDTKEKTQKVIKDMKIVGQI